MTLLAQLTEVAVEGFLNVFDSIAPLVHTTVAKVTVDNGVEIFIVGEVAAHACVGSLVYVKVDPLLRLALWLKAIFESLHHRLPGPHLFHPLARPTLVLLTCENAELVDIVS